MSQSLSRRSFLKCAGSGAVSLAAALLTGVSAAALAPCYQGEPALLDGKAAVELLGYAPAPGLGGALVYLSVENLSAKTLAVGASYLLSREVATTDELYTLGVGLTARCDGKPVRCGAMLHCFCEVPENWETLELTYQPAFAASQPMTFVVRRGADEVQLGPVPASPAEVGSVVDL